MLYNKYMEQVSAHQVKEILKGLDERYLEVPTIVQQILSEIHGVYLSLDVVRILIRERYVDNR